MVEFFFQALVDMFTPAHLFFLTLGALLGMLVGILPGLGGIDDVVAKAERMAAAAA